MSKKLTERSEKSLEQILCSEKGGIGAQKTLGVHVIINLQISKLRLRKARQFAQGHTAKWQRQDLNLVVCDSKTWALNHDAIMPPAYIFVPLAHRQGHRHTYTGMLPKLQAMKQIPTAQALTILGS